MSKRNAAPQQESKADFIDIGIPVNKQILLETRMMVQGGSGSGKSHTLRVILEKLSKKVHLLVIDPEGEYVSLREKFPFLLAGKKGDIPISVNHAETIAIRLLEMNVSAILDMSEMGREEQIQFVKRFGNALLSSDERLHHAVVITLDEAQIFCPEDRSADSTKTVSNLLTMGRKRGFCTILATQRISEVKKTAVAECNNILIGRTALDLDQRRVGKMLGYTKQQDIIGLLIIMKFGLERE